MTITRSEGVREILDELGRATDAAALALACVGEAYEQLTTAPADRLEESVFRPAQSGFTAAKKAYLGYAARAGVDPGGFETPSAGLPSQGVKGFLERAAVAASEAEHVIAELQDSLLPIEFGDPELRAGLSAAREGLARVAPAAKVFLASYGR